MFIEGLPTGAGRGHGGWRGTVRSHAHLLQPGSPFLRLDFTLPPRRWVDLDTILTTTVAGLRDGAVYGRGLAGLEGVLARKHFGAPAGVTLSVEDSLLGVPPPGPTLLAVDAAQPPTAERASKVAWRDRIVGAWAGRASLDGPVWADVRLWAPRSLLSRLEVVLDGLEPVLGRDPRGRAWQEFFPADDRIMWLRVVRAPLGQGLGLELGPVDAEEERATGGNH